MGGCQRNVDVAGCEDRKPCAEGHGHANDGEENAGERGRAELRSEDDTPPRLEEQRRPDRHVPELVRDGEETGEGRKEHGIGRGRAEQRALVVLPR